MTWLLWLGLAGAGELGAGVALHAWPGGARLEPTPALVLRGAFEGTPAVGGTVELLVSGGAYPSGPAQVGVVQGRVSVVLDGIVRRHGLVRFGIGPVVGGQIGVVGAVDERFVSAVGRVGMRLRVGAELGRPTGLRFVPHLGVNLSPWGVEVDLGVGLGWRR